MTTISDYQVSDHERCDELFAQVQVCVDLHQWEDVDLAFSRFHQALSLHMRMEEEVLFPAFQQAMSHAEGPVDMLRMEHRQIVGILDRMSAALTRKITSDFVRHSETYTILMQQHKLKEEKMLYPLLDKILSKKPNNVSHAMIGYLRMADDSICQERQFGVA